MEVAQNRLGHLAAGPVAEMPLQPAEPQHEFGHRHRRVQFEAEELVRVHGGLREIEPVALAGDEVGQHIQNLALQPLHHFEGDVEEVCGAAGRIENPDGAKPRVEAANGVRRAGDVARVGF